MSIRVVIADDHALVRGGLRRVFETDSDIEVVAEAEDGLGAVAAVKRTDPDVVLMDIRMPALDGLEATRRITAAHPERPRVVVLTTFGSDGYVLDAVRAGASGFVLKEAPPERLLAAVHAVAAGDAVLDPGVTRALLEHVAAAPAPSADMAGRLAALTPREREVLEALARGLSNAEIARELHMGEGTVKTHVARLLAKTGARDRVQAVIFAHESGVTGRR